jgi:ribosomal-protein-alanine N-acetyltransferase
VNSVIQSKRLDLIPITPAALRLVLAGDFRGAGELLGVSASADWDISRCALNLRLKQLEENPGLQPWLLRAISLRDRPLLVGHIGFHTAPGAEYLARLSPAGVEFGFGILEEWRRQGIATEASEAVMRWAREQHQVQRFVLSISPDNVPSLGLATKLGFRKIGSHIDELDGPEDIFERTYAPSECPT